MHRPLRYRLHLDPDAASKTFAGDVEITCAIEDGVDELRLDCESLQIDDVSIDGVAVSWHVEPGALVIAAKPGEQTLRIRYRGALDSKRTGLYLGEGFIATQMQPAYARRVFPCFDDPRHRCVVELSVMADAGHVAISNAQVADAGDASQRRCVTFAPSPPLPTYLLALAVGPFEPVRADTHPPLAVHALHTAARFAPVLQHARAAVRFYEESLARPFPFGKLDVVVLPRAPIAGMENAGAIFLREDDAMRAELVAHEVAHQWFGGLVTPRSWDELWLNEGFATWLAAKALPQLEADEVRLLREALHRDSGAGSHPLAGRDTHDITALFDVTAYRKGAGLLRMLEAWIGEDAFRRGLHAYLEAHALGTASSQDLWRSVQSHTDLPVVRVAGGFATRPGSPHLAIAIDGDTVEVTQATQEIWSVPMRLRVSLDDGTQSTVPVLLEARSTSLKLPRPVRWVFGNADAAGWYRCTNRDALPPVDALSAVEATVLIEDAWIALWAGELDLIAYLSLAARSPHAHLDEVKDLLASGARAAHFARWLGQDVSEPPAASPSDLDDASLDEPARIAAVEASLANPATRTACWAFVKQNWDRIGTQLLGWGGRGLFAGLCAFSDPAAAADIAQFFAAHPVAGAEDLLRATLARIAARSRFREVHQPTMDAFLMHLDAPAGPPSPRTRDEHALLALMAGGFRGAWLQRMLLDHLKIDAPPSMHTADNLRGASAAAERQLLLAYRGAPSVRPAEAELAQHLIRDLDESAQHIASALERGDLPALASALVRASAMHEREREAEFVFASLFEPEAAAPLRIALASARAESAHWQAGLPAASHAADMIRLHAALVPNILRLHAQRLRSRLAALGFADSPERSDARVQVTLPDGAMFDVEIARDFASGRVGLMHRDAIPERGGMLFLHDHDDLRPVTMRHVRVPLDVAWLDEHGTVLHVEHSLPPWRDGPFPHEHEEARCRSVLELPGGAALRHGVVRGSRVRIAQ